MAGNRETLAELQAGTYDPATGRYGPDLSGVSVGTMPNVLRRLRTQQPLTPEQEWANLIRQRQGQLQAYEANREMGLGQPPQAIRPDSTVEEEEAASGSYPQKRVR